MKHLGLLLFLCNSLRAWTLQAPGLQGWATNPLTFYVSTVGCGKSADVLLAQIDRALSVWNSSPTAGIVLTRNQLDTTVDPEAFADGHVSPTPLIFCDANFSSDLGVNGNVIPAAASVSAEAGSPLSYGGVYLNVESGAGANINSIEDGKFELILAHEIGHVLGLGHSSVEKALMYYSVAGKTKPILTQDDVDGLMFLYPRNELTGGFMGCANAKNNSEMNPAFSGILFLLWLALSLAAGRFRSAPLPSLRELLP